MVNRILVCGGAGYIGSHMVRLLLESGFEVVVFDDLSTGHSEAVGGAEIIQGDILDSHALYSAFEKHEYSCVMHFCAKSLVAESVRAPLRYYRNNIGGTISLLEAMKRYAVKNLVFSSTAAIFGEPCSPKIDEEHPKRPLNPYGFSKLASERIISDAMTDFGLSAVMFRYFNAAGASMQGGIGESHDPETHLIPNVVKALCVNAPGLRIFGDDYPTPDGTCIRDYVHVDDLASAHLAGMRYLELNSGIHAFNLGNDEGFSVLEVIEKARQIAGKEVPYEIVDRRAGDPAILVSCSDRARSELGWCPAVSDLDSIISSALAWELKRTY